MERLFIKVNKNGYTPEQCEKTLTVGELIEILQEYDESIPVLLNNDHGYTYGSIYEDDIYTK